MRTILILTLVAGFASTANAYGSNDCWRLGNHSAFEECRRSGYESAQRQMLLDQQMEAQRQAQWNAPVQMLEQSQDRNRSVTCYRVGQTVRCQ